MIVNLESTQASGREGGGIMQNNRKARAIVRDDNARKEILKS